MKIVIRAGGHGTRLWPLSRRHKPKQFQEIFGNKVLLRMAFERVYPLVTSCEDMYVSCNEEYVEALTQLIPEISSQNYILEPEARNTGAAIALETAYLRAHGVAEDAVVLTIPSDDYIGDESAFRMLMQDIEQFLKNHSEYVVAPSTLPVVPSDGYTYVSTGALVDETPGHSVTLLADWVEKPDQARSRELIATGRYYAHIGMYAWTMGTAARLWEQYKPEVWAAAQEAVVAMGTGDRSAVQRTYATIPAETIETMLMQHVSELATVVDTSMQWSDVGKWQTIKHLLSKNEEGNVHRGTIVSHESTGNLVFAPEGKMVAVLGMEDMIIVDTDDVLLICPAEKSGEIKSLIKKISDHADGARHL
jgi:mannose-1-phosphate guanylyltransferase